MSGELSAMVPDLVIETGGVAARVVDCEIRGRASVVDPEVTSTLAAELAGDPAALAALLDGDLPERVREVLRRRGWSAPSAGDLAWRCDCGGTDGTCAHATATWATVEAALRREPALALTVRGCDVGSLAREASGLAAARSVERDPGVDAARAYERAARGVPRIPDVAIPAQPGRAGFSLDGAALPHQRLHDQAADAAARALDILLGTGDGCLGLDRLPDLARLGAGLQNDWDVDHLAWRAGLSPAELRARVLAWRSSEGGARAVAAAATGPPPSSPEDEEAGEQGQLTLF